MNTTKAEKIKHRGDCEWIHDRYCECGATQDAWGDIWTSRHYERYYVIRIKDNNIGCFWGGKGLIKL